MATEPVSARAGLAGRVSIPAKILALVGVMALVAGAIAGASVWAVSSLNTASNQLGASAAQMRLGARLNQEILELNRAEYRAAMHPENLPDIRAETRDRRDRIETLLADAKAIAAKAEMSRLTKLQTAYEAYVTDLETTFDKAAALRDGDGNQNAVLSSVRESRESATKARETAATFVNTGAEQTTAREKAAASTAATAEQVVLIVAVAGIAVGLVVSWLVARWSIVSPLRAAVESMTRLAEGERNVEVHGAGRGDEVGEIAQALDYFKQQAEESDRLKREQAEAERKAEAERRQEMDKLAERFRRDVGGLVDEVTSATQQLQQAADRMSTVSGNTRNQAQSVASAAEQASSNVNTVASSSEELSNSIQEISGQVAHTSEQARSARDAADTAGDQVDELATAANQIGDVVSMIKDIAEQTNLLALNATIEAARAGEAGKGFAVVAGEVKNLASQTTKATDDISERISNIQNQTNDAVSAISNIAKTVRDIDESASSIASAIEEQTAATRDISSNVQEASTGTAEVTKNISGVNEAAKETSSAAEQVDSAVKQLHGKTTSLKEKAESFVASVKSG